MTQQFAPSKRHRLMLERFDQPTKLIARQESTMSHECIPDVGYLCRVGTVRHH